MFITRVHEVRICGVQKRQLKLAEREGRLDSQQCGGGALWQGGGVLAGLRIFDADILRRHLAATSPPGIAACSRAAPLTVEFGRFWHRRQLRALPTCPKIDCTAPIERRRRRRRRSSTRR